MHFKFFNICTKKNLPRLVSHHDPLFGNERVETRIERRKRKKERNIKGSKILKERKENSKESL